MHDQVKGTYITCAFIFNYLLLLVGLLGCRLCCSYFYTQASVLYWVSVCRQLNESQYFILYLLVVPFLFFLSVIILLLLLPATD